MTSEPSGYRSAVIDALSQIKGAGHNVQEIDSLLQRLIGELNSGSPSLKDVKDNLALEQLVTLAESGTLEPGVRAVIIYLENTIPNQWQELLCALRDHRDSKKVYWDCVAVTPWE